MNDIALWGGFVKIMSNYIPLQKPYCKNCNVKMAKTCKLPAVIKDVKFCLMLWNKLK